MNSGQHILVKTPTIASKIVTLRENDYLQKEQSKTSIIMVDSGAAYAVISGISYSLAVGDIIIIPRTEYTLQPANHSNSSAVVLTLGGFQYSGLEENRWPFFENESLILSSVSTEPVMTTIKQIHRELEDKQVGYETSSAKLAEYLFILIQRYCSDPSEEEVESTTLLAGIKDYIEKNYEKNITLNSLSEVFFVSPFHISHLFKEKYNISPIQYLIKTRMRVASTLLAQTKHTIFEVSCMVGYPNANYFHMLFKRFTGMSPGKYRKTHAKDNV
ncbi:AraC family transcriptional regulator [Christensenellaceae bacterium OttesenSCG-928-K19]|nr:AraC family transcriptional regulator [Christensenellaceae bacterium OttesenSCG-928-K19]